MLVVHFNVLSWQKEKVDIPGLVSPVFFFVLVIVLVCRIQKIYILLNKLCSRFKNKKLKEEQK